MKALKQIVRHYYKYNSWTQPTLSSNGTLGGNSFAVKATTERSSTPAYYAINGSVWVGATGTSTQSATYTFYSPVPIRVTQVQWSNNNAAWYNVTGGTFQGSINGSTWVDLGTIDSNNTANAERTIAINNPNLYFYYRWNITSISKNSSNDSSGGSLKNIIITANGIEEGTSSDYDFYKDIDEYSCYKSGADYYAFNI